MRSRALLFPRLTFENSYIYPANLRQRMTDLWNEDVTHWWLPDDEGYPAIIKAIRDFVQYRAGIPTDAASVDVRDMSGIFRDMQVREGEAEESRGTGTDSDHLDPSMTWESSPEQPWT